MTADGVFRNLPNITLPAVEIGYAVMLASGWDTVIEAFDMSMLDSLAESLEEERLVAEKQDTPHTFTFGGEDVQMSPIRGRGVKWWFSNEDFTVKIRSPKMGWAVSVRYSAVGLWSHGWDVLRGRALKMLLAEMLPNWRTGQPLDTWQRVSEAHYAFDFHSPEFSGEMVPDILRQVLCHSSTKKSAITSLPMEVWGRAEYLETLTIGKRAPLEIQVYDKGKEITEVSGKLWMLKLWKRAGYHPPDGVPKDVWRVEIRMRKDFLKARNANTVAMLRCSLPELIAEALYTRRLTTPTDDTNRARWPLHRLWAAAWYASGEAVDMLPLGQQVNGSGQAIQDQLLQMAGGLIRSAAVLESGDWDHLGHQQISNRVYEAVKDDPELEKKVEKAWEKYKHVTVVREDSCAAIVAISPRIE